MMGCSESNGDLNKHSKTLRQHSMKMEFDKIKKSAEPDLNQFGFELIQNWDGGMHKVFKWSNQTFQFSLIYDRGYYDCHIATINSPVESYDLIWLLRFIQNDKSFYEKELKEAGLWDTLPIEGYVSLFLSNVEVISSELMKDQLKEAYTRFMNG